MLYLYSPFPVFAESAIIIDERGKEIKVLSLFVYNVAINSRLIQEQTGKSEPRAEPRPAPKPEGKHAIDTANNRNVIDIIKENEYVRLVYNKKGIFFTTKNLLAKNVYDNYDFDVNGKAWLLDIENHKQFNETTATIFNLILNLGDRLDVLYRLEVSMRDKYKNQEYQIDILKDISYLSKEGIKLLGAVLKYFNAVEIYMINSEIIKTRSYVYSSDLKHEVQLKEMQASQNKSISESIRLFVEFAENFEKDVNTARISIKDSKGGVTFEVK